jgi:hypothetical protein
MNWRGHDDVMQIRSFRGSGEPAWVGASLNANGRWLAVLSPRGFGVGLAVFCRYILASIVLQERSCRDRNNLPSAKSLPRTYECPALRKAFAAFPADSKVVAASTSSFELAIGADR